MNQIPFWVLFISFFLLLHTTKSKEEEEVKRSLINFLEKLSNSPPDPIWGWNLTSDPCKDQWKGITCDKQNLSVRKIILDGLHFSGTLDAGALCDVQSLTLLSLDDNSISGENLDQIGNCTQLTHFHISGNRFSGSLPNSLSGLNNLKGLDISNNNFSGNFPDLTQISGLTEFLAQNNQISGSIPNFDFSNLVQFNVSFNNLSGPIPYEARRFPVSCFIGNPELCGDPLPNRCPSLRLESESTETKNKSKGVSKNQILMFSGYFVIGLALLLVIFLRMCNKNKKKEEKVDAVLNKVAAVDDSINKASATSSDQYKKGMSMSMSKSENFSDESTLVSSSLIVLTSPEVNGLRFEDLLKAPAELLGRGKHGSVYKVICEGGMTLAVKRIKDWTIWSNDFKQRMRRLDQVKHPNVMPPMAFYCSMQEKLLVYEYQHNGSLFSLLHGTQVGQAFDWSSRLGIAATIAEALAFMHHELREDGIAHGNLKLSNILLNKNMKPCISEYGLMVVDNLDQPSFANVNSHDSFKSDIYGFGVILLELLTGKLVQNNGLDLARWVLSVVREEWTVEVFDKTLIREGASEERMVNLLQVAIKCVNGSLEARPSMNQVALMINTIQEDEERSILLSDA